MGRKWWIGALVGTAIGIAGTTLFYLSISLDVTRYFLSGFITLAIAAVISLVGVLWFSSKQRRAVGDLSEKISGILLEWSTVREKGLAALDESKKREIKSNFQSLTQFLVSVLATIRAFGFVFGAATISVSAAILVATLMQVDRLDSQNQLSEASRRSALINELTAILNEIDEEIDFAGTTDRELEETNDRKAGQGADFVPAGFVLSDRLIWRITALSRSLQPYKFLENERLSAKAYSPERAQLLVALVASGVELKDIWSRGIFDAAYLRGAELPNINLRDIKLNYSTLEDANLIVSDLSNCWCREVKFDNSMLQLVNFTNAILNGSSFQNARLPDAHFFRNAKLDSVDMEGAIVVSETWLRDMTELDEPPEGFALEDWFVEQKTTEWFREGISAGTGYRIRRSKGD